MERNEAIVAGAGPAGLAVAAALKRRGVPVVVLERSAAVGDRWRSRYDGLRLNTMRQFSSMPGYRIRRAAGRYPSRAAFVGYLEDYAAHHELDIRFGVELERVDRDGVDGTWILNTNRGALAARHAVIATGFDAVPRFPDIPGREDYRGDLIHAQAFKGAAEHAGKEVLVIGGGNTGVDIAGLLDRAGARVLFALRTPPNLFPRDLGGLPLQLSGVAMEPLPSLIGDSGGRLIQRLAFGDLSRYGVPPAPAGYMTKFRAQLVGPAVDDGFVAGLKAGRIEVVAGVSAFENDAVVLADASRLSPDLVICATGYERGLEPVVGHLGVLRPDGNVTNWHGAPEHPAAKRLYFAGFYGTTSGQLRVFPRHARRIARAVARSGMHHRATIRPLGP